MKRPFILIAVIVSLLTAQSVTYGKTLIEEKRIVLDSEGWKIVGDLVMPKSKIPVPAVILLNKAAGNRKAYESLAIHLANSGIASIRVDLRGHGESINKGKFDPSVPREQRVDLGAIDPDVWAVFQHLSGISKVDKKRIGFVGASYSGEIIMKFARKHLVQGKAYVMLSPGDFSDESINGIDASGIPFLFIKSVDELPFFVELFAAIRHKSKTAQIMEVNQLNGKRHATDILEVHPEVVEMIAIWFKHKL